MESTPISFFHSSFTVPQSEGKKEGPTLPEKEIPEGSELIDDIL